MELVVVVVVVAAAVSGRQISLINTPLFFFSFEQ